MTLRRGVVFATCLAGLALAVGITLAQAEPRRSGTNLVKEFHLSIEVPAGSRLCQRFELVPGDTANLSVIVANVGGRPPALDVRILAEDGGLVSRGHVSYRYGAGALAVPIQPPVREPAGARVCIQNRGDSAVALGAGPTPAEQAATVDAGVQAGRIRIEYLRDGSESWWALLPTIAHRFGIGRGGLIGSWALWAAGLLLLLAIAISARLLTGRDAAA